MQPLSAFEGRPVAAAARNYDLIVFDHPHVGEIAEFGLLRTADEVIAGAGLSDADFIGPSLASYRLGGKLWGLPLDAAAQVSCARPDVLARLGLQPPGDWAGMLELGSLALANGLQLAIGLSGVHSLMTLLSLCANLGGPLGQVMAVPFVDRDVPRRALELMAELLTFCPRDVLDWNSIATQDAMLARNDLIFCPLVYGFAPYSHQGRVPRLDYGNATLPQPGWAGSTLGGAGLGISSSTSNPEAALAVSAFLIDATTQSSTIAMNLGQPARHSAWEDPTVDAAAGGFYSGTRLTLERGWVRPRFSGYLNFQRAAGHIVEGCLRGQMSHEGAIERLEHIWREVQPFES